MIVKTHQGSRDRDDTRTVTERVRRSLGLRGRIIGGARTVTAVVLFLLLRHKAMMHSRVDPIAVAERLGVQQVLTLDRAHLSIVRPRHVHTFELLP